VILVAP